MTTTTTTTTVPSGVEHNRDKVAGFAVYVEFRGQGADSDVFSQTLLISELASPTTGQVQGVMMQARLISTTQPARSWRTQISPEHEVKGTSSATNRLVRGTTNVTQSLMDATKNFEKVAMYFDAMSMGSWLLVGVLALEVSDSDAASIFEARTPRGLIDRLNRQRDASGFPALPTKDSGAQS